MATAVYQISIPPTKRQRISTFECNNLYESSYSFHYRHPKRQPTLNYRNYSKNNRKLDNESSKYNQSLSILSVINDSSKQDSHRMNKPCKQTANIKHNDALREAGCCKNASPSHMIPPISLQDAHSMKSSTINMYRLSTVRPIICDDSYKNHDSKINNDNNENQDDDDDIDIFHTKPNGCSIMDILCDIKKLSL